MYINLLLSSLDHLHSTTALPPALVPESSTTEATRTSFSLPRSQGPHKRLHGLASRKVLGRTDRFQSRYFLKQSIEEVQTRLEEVYDWPPPPRVVDGIAESFDVRIDAAR